MQIFKIIAHSKYIWSWISKELSDKTCTPYATSDNSLTPLIDCYGSKVRVKFNKGCLKQSNKLTYDYGRKVNIYIVYELGASSSNNSNPTLKNCFFGAVNLTKKRRYWKIWVFWFWNCVCWKNNLLIFWWWVWSKDINFWGRYEFFCSHW